SAIVGKGLEDVLTRAGAEGTLKAAREAAARGDLAAMNRLTEQLEAHLTQDQARTLREQLYADFRTAARRPPGTATATREQEALRQQASRKADGASLSPAERQAELDLVAASQPQPSTLAGYVDEVDLANDHIWRRQTDGTWCRFSKRTLCGTRIPGAK